MHSRVIVLLLLLSVCTWAQRAPATGPLKVSESNSHWFVDPSGKAIVLAGSHVWQNLQDNGLIMRGATSNPPPVFDYDGYLRKLEAWNHNFFRLWRWETTKWTDVYGGGGVKFCSPHPWVRSGPGNAEDAEPKFDLNKFDESYFARLRDRVQKAGQRGFYVSVMLFEGWENQFSDGWKHHPFHAANNVNGVEGDTDGDGKGLEYNTLRNPKVLALQEAYVRKVIDTVNDLPNVLYEISNEAHGDSTEWQYHFIRFVKEYERKKAQQHPVGMTFQYKGGTNQILNDSPADWISPNPGNDRESYRTNPCANCSQKVVVSDTDHLWGHTGGDNTWVWKTFTRGLNPLLMEEMLPSPTWQDSARQAMGQVVALGSRVALASMRPENGLSQTGHCLAARGREYVVFQYDKGEFSVNLKDATGDLQAQWLEVNRNVWHPPFRVEGGDARIFTTPFPGPAVLWIKK